MISVVLSFDDGRADNMRVVDEILSVRNVPVTINISTAYVDGTISEANRPCPNPAMTVADVKRLAAMPLVELAGHGDEHLNTTEDLARGLKKLRSWMKCDPGDSSDVRPNTMAILSTDICGIASPNSNLSESAILANRKTYEDLGIEYVRIGPGETYRGVRRVAGKLSRMTGSDRLFWDSNKGVADHFEGSFVVHSIPVMRPHRPEQIRHLIAENAARGTDVALMFHSIVKNGEDYHDDTWSYDHDDFVMLVDWLINRQDVILQTMRDAVRGQIVRTRSEGL